jgi:hypothetical protein
MPDCESGFSGFLYRPHLKGLHRALRRFFPGNIRSGQRSETFLVFGKGPEHTKLRKLRLSTILLPRTMRCNC